MIDDPPGKRNYWSAEYLADFGDDAVAAFVKASADMPAGFSQNLMVPWGGAVARVSDADTPMTNREAAWVFHPFGVWEGAERDAEHIALGEGRAGDDAQVRDRRHLPELHRRRRPGPGARRVRRQELRHGSPGSSASTTPRTSSTATRTSSPPDQRRAWMCATTGAGRRRRWGCGAPTRRASRWWRGGARRASRRRCAPAGRGSAGPRRAGGRPGGRGRRRRGARR